jgi:transcriptional regulator with XRE-family HTH domain
MFHTMNDRYLLNSALVQAYLDREDRKQSHLVKKLDISGSLVSRMLSQERHVPKQETLEELANLLGVKVDDLLIPRNCST